MSKKRKLDKMRRAPRRLSLAAWAFLGSVCLLALAGCRSNPTTHAGDPLYGEYYPRGANGQLTPPANTAPAKTTSGVLPYPSNNSASSTAAIAGNTGLPGSRPLSINENAGTNWTLTTTSGPGEASIFPATRGGAPIVQPIPRDTSSPAQVPASTPGLFPSSGNTVIATGSWSSAAPSTAPVPPLGTVTPELLQGTLQGKGAVGLRQENVLEGVRVSCYVPQRSNSANLRYLETTARDYPTALQALLQQVDQ